MPAGGDCELLRGDLWGQPANAFSALAFVVVGITLVRSRPAIGWLACGVGVGSFLFHGPMPAGADWVHDTSLAVLLMGLMLERRPRALAAAGIATGIAFALFPAVSDASIILLGALTAGMLLRTTPFTPPIMIAGAILVTAGIVALLSRTGGPLCRPESWLQGHALWHVGAALALLIWAHAAAGDATPALGQPSRASTPKGPTE